MFHFSLPNKEIAWLDVSMQHSIVMQELNPFQHLHASHQDSLESQAAATSTSQGVQVEPQLFED